MTSSPLARVALRVIGIEYPPAALLFIASLFNQGGNENKYDSQDNPLSTSDVSFVFIGAF